MGYKPEFKKGDLIIPYKQSGNWNIFKEGVCSLVEVLDVNHDSYRPRYEVKVIESSRKSDIGHIQYLAHHNVEDSFILIGDLFEKLVEGSITQETYEKTLGGRE